MKHKETLPEQVRAFLQEQQMVQAGDTVCCALSGGADSVCLLRCLLELAEPLHLTITAVHVNHQLRGAESERDAAFCESLCTRWNVPLHMVRCDVNAYAEQHHASIETAARACRYAAFSAIPANHIATAHTASDNLETMLHRLIRGSGLRWLAGIPAVRERYIRPLLTVTRADVEAYLQTLGQDYVTDSTNLEDEYTRNKIRLNLLPLMQEINPSVKNTLIDTSNYLNDIATIYNKCIEETKKKIITAEGIRISDLVKEPAPEAILFEVLHPLGFNSAQIKDITHSLHSQPGKQFCSKEWRVIKDREFLLIETAESENETLPPFQIIKEEKEYTPDFLIPREKEIACFDADKLNGEIHYRKWQPGDTFIPFGMKGKKKISDYLTDRKFSISQKERQWVLCCGEHIAWLIGERTDNRFRIDETTKRVVIYKIV